MQAGPASPRNVCATNPNSTFGWNQVETMIDASQFEIHFIASTQGMRVSIDGEEVYNGGYSAVQERLKQAAPTRSPSPAAHRRAMAITIRNMSGSPGELEPAKSAAS